MKYILLIYHQEGDIDESTRNQCYADSAKLIHELDAAKKFLGSSPLHRVSTATSVRLRDGKRIVTDGPFAETHEQLGGYYLVDVEDLDEAVEIAARVPVAKYGTVEVRPLIELPQSLKVPATV